MKARVLSAGSLLIAAVAALSEGVVQWSIEKRQLQAKFGKRAPTGTFEEVITNEKARGGYFATCSVGNPPQNLTLQLDTGSSDIWVPAASACRNAIQHPDGCHLGTFTSTESRNFTTVGKGKFSIQYVDGSFSKGDYFIDAFEIGGATVANVTMGLGLETDISYGLVGVGYALNEAGVSGNKSSSNIYPNLPVTMMNDGMINTNAYSLWLNDLDASTGNILFGGVDTEKYVGNLTRIQVYEDEMTQSYTSFIVALTSLEAHSVSGTDTLTSRSFPIPVILDSGTTLSYLPTDLAQQIWKEVGAIWSPDYQLAVLPCSMQTSKGYFSFGFAGPNGPKIKVRMDELVLDLTTGEPPMFLSGTYKGQAACEFGIQNFSSDPFLLGDTFLRSAYVVYDLINNEVGIAPTDFNSTTSNIIAFPSRGAAIPSATVAPNQGEAAIKPTMTTPAFVAQTGFSEGVRKDSGTPVKSSLGRARLTLIGVAMVLVSLG